MQKKISIGGFLLVILTIGLLLIIGLSRINPDEAKNVYQVYLDGKKIGLIENREALYDLIDAEQETIKKEFKVDKVYPPEGLEAIEYTTYSKKLKTAEEIYRMIAEKSNFTIAGYTITIKPSEGEAKTINILNREDIEPALKEAVSAFIKAENLEAYIKDNQIEITDTGKIIRNIYFEEKITVKEAFLNVEDMIIDNASDLTKYLLFGTLEDQEEYTVKDGDTIATVAEANKLNTAELLIANQNLVSEKALLSPGQKLNIGLINPLFNVVEESEIVEDVQVPFKTVTEKDKTLYANYKTTKQEGSQGLSRVRETVKARNGERLSVIINENTELKAPVDKIVVVGTKPTNSFNYVPPDATGDWVWPTLTPYILTTKFEYRWGRLHGALDISGAGGKGAPIFSATDAVVVEVNTSCPERGYLGSMCGGSYGNFVKVKTGSYTIIYAHMLKNIKVSPGQNLTKGQVIGSMGSSGSSTGPHLHFEINDPSGGKVNPCKVAFQC